MPETYEARDEVEEFPDLAVGEPVDDDTAGDLSTLLDESDGYGHDPAEEEPDEEPPANDGDQPDEDAQPDEDGDDQ